MDIFKELCRAIKSGRRIDRAQTTGSAPWTRTTWSLRICIQRARAMLPPSARKAMQLLFAEHITITFMTSFAKVSPRLKPLAVFPQQDPQEAAREIRRAVKELGLVGVSIKTTGLTLPLGHRFYDPIYEEAQNLGCLLGVHGTRKGTQELAVGNV